MKKNLFKRVTAIALGAILFVPCTLTVSADSITSTVTSQTSVRSSNYMMNFNSTKLPDPTPLDDDVKNQIIEDYIKMLNGNGYDFTSDKASVEYYGTLKDGSMLVHTHHDNLEYCAVMTYDPLGKYIYVYTGGADVKIYKNNSFYSIIDLYNSGEISDEDIEDIASYLNLESLKTKEDVESLIRNTALYGGTPLDADYKTALINANALLKDENTTLEQYTAAYFELEILSRDRDWEVYDKTEIRRCYSYCIELLKSFCDDLDEETLTQLSAIENDILMDILYPVSQENIDSKTADYTEQLSAIACTTENSNFLTFEEVLKIKELAENYFEVQPENSFSETVCAALPRFADFDGYRIYNARFDIVSPMLLTKRMGNYIFEGFNYYYPSDLGYLVINPDTGDVVELEEAVENQVIDIDELYEYSKEQPFVFTMYLLGDADDDGELSIKDATLVQKASLNLEEIESTETGADTVFDYDNDGRVCIVDVTKIQKALVLN